MTFRFKEGDHVRYFPSGVVGIIQSMFVDNVGQRFYRIGFDNSERLETILEWNLTTYHVQPIDKAFRLVLLERQRQDAKWGGPEHDDEHTSHDWFGYIMDHCDSVNDVQARKHLVEIAALAVAALESLERKENKQNGTKEKAAD